MIVRNKLHVTILLKDNNLFCFLIYVLTSVYPLCNLNVDTVQYGKMTVHILPS